MTLRPKSGETYLERRAREDREAFTRAQNHHRVLIKRFTVLGILIGVIPFAITMVYRPDSSDNSYSAIGTWFFGFVMILPLGWMIAIGGLRSLIPRQPKEWERIHTGHGFSAKPPDILIQAFLLISMLFFAVLGIFVWAMRIIN